MWTVYVVVMVHKSFHRGHPIRWHALFVAQKMTVHIGHQKGSFVFAFTSLTPVLNINNRSRMMRSRNWYPYLHVKHAELGGMARGQNHIGQIRLQAWFLLARGVKWKDYNTAGVVESWKVLGVKKSLFIPTSLLFPHPCTRGPQGTGTTAPSFDLPQITSPTCSFNCPINYWRREHLPSLSWQHTTNPSRRSQYQLQKNSRNVCDQSSTTSLGSCTCWAHSNDQVLGEA